MSAARPGGRERHAALAAAAARDERPAERFLERLQRLGDRRLRHVHARRGLGQRAELLDVLEQHEVAQPELGEAGGQGGRHASVPNDSIKNI